MSPLATRSFAYASDAQSRRNAIAPTGRIPILDLVEDLGPADPVDQVLQPHQLGPDIGTAQRERSDARGLQLLVDVEQLGPGGGRLELVLGEDRLVVEEDHGL